jgi:hypothetical protein
VTVEGAKRNDDQGKQVGALQIAPNLRDVINAHWPPVTPDRQRQTAIDAAFAALDAMSQPNLAVGTDVKTIEAIGSEHLKGKGVTKLTLETDHQLFKVTAAFDVSLKPVEIDTDQQNREWVEKFKPHVVGRVELFLGAATTMVTSPKRALQVKLLPAFKSIHVERIALADSYDVTAAGAILADLLNAYADNITGSFTNDPILNAELPVTLQDQFDPSGPIKINPVGGGDFKLTLSSKPIHSPYGLGSVAPLIDNTRVVVLAQLSPVGILPAPRTVSGKAFGDFVTAFSRHMSDGLGLQSLPAGAWVAIAKALIADTFNSAFDQAHACLNGSGSIPKQTFSKKIPTPDPASIDCTPKMDCAPTQACNLQEDTRDCRRLRNCAHNHDTRDCRKCVAGICGNDPFCETAKAAQNVEYDTAFNACNALGSINDAACEAEKRTQNELYATQKAQCEAGKAATKLACETSKTGLKVACEGLKGAVDALHHTGNVGNLDGSVSGTGNVQTCLREVSFTKDLRSLSMKLQTTGSAGLDTGFKFTPLDVAGHVLCQLPWTADKRINATIPSQMVGVGLSLAKSPNTSEYRGQLEATPIHLHFEPSPLSLILQNVNFYLACPVTSQLINGMTLNLAPFIPEVLTDYTDKLDPINFSFVSDIPEQPLFGQTIKPRLSETPKALVVSGSL